MTKKSKTSRRKNNAGLPWMKARKIKSSDIGLIPHKWVRIKGRSRFVFRKSSGYGKGPFKDAVMINGELKRWVHKKR